MKLMTSLALLLAITAAANAMNLRTVLRFRQENEVNDVVCPDQSSCPDGSTCCQDTQGGYACCPLPDAVCCSDKTHCCPNGYKCDVSAGICTRGNDIINLFTKKPAKPAPVNDVVCPDQSSCPDGNTCCQDTQGGYACCPLPDAVCCSDKTHCCPNGYKCDVSAGICTRGNDVINLFTKKPAKPAPVNDVVCPDQSSCPDGNTCCKDTQGGYACCPLPKAVCCSDKTHCCPNGYTCDVSAGTCNRGNDIINLFTKQPAKPAPVNDVVCPDQSSCPDGNTCCKDTQGGYGCCPLPDAVCCSDKTHCCPNGYKCDVSAGTCNRGNDIINLFTKQPAKPAPVNDVVCPDQSSCPDGNTCCQDTQGGYGCCPLPDAVCCSDKTHCCPNGYTCDVSAGTCNRGNDIINLFTKQPAKPAPVNDVVCPDQSSCPDGNTCCQDTQGGYGCCPLPDAVCCSDKTHCCPNGYTCDVSAGTCNRGNDIINLFTKQPAKPAPVNDVVCPDQSSCPDGNTCCQDTQGGYACCPLPDAVCCSDKTHCCPNGYKCDVSAGICTRGNDILNFFTKQPAKPAPVNDVVCPDQSSCPDGNTCCQDTQGGYACCPLPDAVCCSDKTHCCPNGYKCDVSAGICTRGNDIINLFTKQPAKPAPVNDVVCPDQSSCPDGNTCCQDTQGGYGCCPLPDAVCCSDKTHCCPNGYTCDVSAGTCNRGNDIINLFTKQPAKPAPVNDVVCPDQSLCPDGNTCCQDTQGGYACCPLPDAVCCSDKTHCCPNGYKCDVSAGICTRGNDILNFFTKQPAKPAQVNDVVCPDQSSCPDGNTCCQDTQGGYACCPLPNAVCCSDKLHCCPNGYTCDVSAGTCNRGNVILNLFTKQPAKPAKENVVFCPDKSMCPDGTTCCRQRGGGYGCCPRIKATCCSDEIHCCPHNFKCDLKDMRCIKGNQSLALLDKRPSKPTPVNDVTCPDQSTCPDGNTCCLDTQGGYACCPLPDAVCCSDKTHCCPNGYKCDVSAGICTRGNDIINLFTKQPAKPAQVNDVVCPDQSSCPDGNTCCKDTQGGYACCPLPNAVCCSDKLHCCPTGYKCDVSAGICTKGNDILDLFTKRPAKPSL